MCSSEGSFAHCCWAMSKNVVFWFHGTNASSAFWQGNLWRFTSLCTKLHEHIQNSTYRAIFGTNEKLILIVNRCWVFSHKIWTKWLQLRFRWKIYYPASIGCAMLSCQNCCSKYVCFPKLNVDILGKCFAAGVYADFHNNWRLNGEKGLIWNTFRKDFDFQQLHKDDVFDSTNRDWKYHFSWKVGTLRCSCWIIDKSNISSSLFNFIVQFAKVAEKLEETNASIE